MNPYQKRMKDALDKMEAIRKKAETEKRAMTAEELTQRETLMAEYRAADTEWKSIEAEEDLRGQAYGGEGGGALTVEGDPNITIPDAPVYRGSNATMLGSQLADIRMISDPKFDGQEVRAARSRIDQNQKRYALRMEALAKKEDRAAATGGATISIPSDGGLFLQGETVVDLMTNGFNNSEILPRMAKRTLTATQFIEIIGIDEKSRKDGSRGGGIRVYTDKELGSVDPSKTTFNKIRVEPKKLTGLFYCSEEWQRNVTFMGQEVRQLFGEEFAFKCQNLGIRGSGAGEGLGALSSGCLVTVPKRGGQVAGTIVSANLSEMWAQYRGMGKNAAWLINRDCRPQLDGLSITAGTSALEPRFVAYDSQGILRIKGAPVIEIEQCETVGTVGDIILADWSQVVAADQGDINEAMSIHVNFIYGQNTYRFTYYFDCQPRWASPITPFKGSKPTSPLVVLATRA
jgi:HK97 family phage major capsid protein